ncbi:hypothetical protein [Brevundimonas nasdae]|uniref:Uncharacterized protein n=1 Tax=Brevundimonas nasdae TaxID=172043 RepID=A0ACD4VLJ7_9CAUL|nr:hypothetical protein [Brevundimonas nasdae]WOB78910.1 hypothetical protein PZA08_01740 [Brevundimonas nasdae]
MRRSTWLSLAACAFLAACQPANSNQKAASDDAAANADVIDAVPLQTDAAPARPSQAQTPPSEKAEPQPAPAQPANAASAPDPEQSSTAIPEAWDMKAGDVQNCRDAIGSAAAARLVERCIRVSPATRPPCNASNPCALIQGEIERSCKLWQGDGDPPAACKP